MKITIWDNGGITMDRYIVLIDKHYFYMSRRPDRANEVNTYGGEFKTEQKSINEMMKRMKFIKLMKIPTSMKYAIQLRCKEIRLASRDE